MLPKRHLDELLAFQDSEQRFELRPKFWRVDPFPKGKFIPCWNTRESERRLNWEASDVLHQSRLCYFKLPELLRLIDCPENLLPPKVFDVAHEDKFLLIIHLWMRGICLPPPVLVLRRPHMLGKRDGFHRLAVASLVGAFKIPCWIAGMSAQKLVQRRGIPFEEFELP
jgi:hypothetical protein